MEDFNPKTAVANPKKRPEIVRISKGLLLFDSSAAEISRFHPVAPGSYAVEEIPNPINAISEPWWKIVGEPWGNARACWQTVRVQAAKRQNPFSSPVQCVAGLIGLVILCLWAVTGLGSFMHKAPPDVAALKMQLTTLTNELQNLTAHYPLMASPLQKAYESRKAEALYGLDVYPKYIDFRNAVQREVLVRRSSLDTYLTVLNTIDDQLYHAWHDWGITNRALIVAQLQRQRARFTTGEMMSNDAAAYDELQLAVLTEDLVGSCTAFTKKLEHEIADHEPALRDIARQNRDCADRAMQLRASINALGPQIEEMGRHKTLLQMVGLSQTK